MKEVVAAVVGGLIDELGSQRDGAQDMLPGSSVVAGPGLQLVVIRQSDLLNTSEIMISFISKFSFIIMKDLNWVSE